jgi:hypothetical protein
MLLSRKMALQNLIIRFLCLPAGLTRGRSPAGVMENTGVTEKKTDAENLENKAYEQNAYDKKQNEFQHDMKSEIPLIPARQ